MSRLNGKLGSTAGLLPIVNISYGTPYILFSDIDGKGNRTGMPLTMVGSVHTNSEDDPNTSLTAAGMDIPFLKDIPLLKDIGFASRIDQARNLNEWARTARDPLILAGDFNAGDISERGLSSDEMYPRGTYHKDGKEVLSNIPVTLNLMKHEFQLLQTEHDRELFSGEDDPDDLRHTWPSKQTEDVSFDGDFHWGDLWHRVKIDHVMAARPYAKWWNVIDDVNDPYLGTAPTEAFVRYDLAAADASKTGTFKTKVKFVDKDGKSGLDSEFYLLDNNGTRTKDTAGNTIKGVPIPLSDHTPVGHQLQWVGPIVDHTTYFNLAKLPVDPLSLGMIDWVKLVWNKEAQKNPVKTEDNGKTFYLTRTNNRTDMYLGQVANADGNPNLSYLNNLDFLQNMTSEELDRNNGALRSELEKKLAFAKTQLDCSGGGASYQSDPAKRFTPQDVMNIQSYCVDDHKVFDEVKIQDGLTIRVDEDAALGRTYSESGRAPWDPKYPILVLENGGTLKIRGTQMRALDRDVHLEGTGGVINVADVANRVSILRPVSGMGWFTKDGAGTLDLTQANTFTGWTHVAGGTLKLTGYYGDVIPSAGVYLTNKDSTFDISESTNSWHPINGLIGESGTKLKLGSNQLEVKIQSDMTFAGQLYGERTSKFTKNGNSTLVLTGDSSQTFIGQTDVKNARLQVDGSLGGTVYVYTVPWWLGWTCGWAADCGELKGHGTIGGINVGSGGRIAPGNSVGTLRVLGDATFDPASVFEIEAGAAGLDRLMVGGVAALDGTLMLGPELSADPAKATTVVNLLGQRRVVLSADGGINSRFATVESDYLFIDANTDYSANELGLTLYRNAAPFAAFGHTFNERATADGLESLPYGNELHDKVTVATDGDGLSRSYAAVSGDIHASLAGTLAADGHFVSDAATTRIRAANDGIAAKAAPVLAFGPDGADKAFFVAADAATSAFWTEAYGSWSSIDSDGNALARDRNIGGFVTGLDGIVNNGLFGNDWRLGLLAGYANTTLEGAGSSASVDSFQIGLYGGTKWNGLGLSYGANLGHHEVDTDRSGSFLGEGFSNSAAYDATSVQIFGEAGYEIDTVFAMFEPFAGAAYTHVISGAFTETGGITALSGISGSTDLATTTLGLRASREFKLGEATLLTAKGMAGWKRGFGDLPEASLAFAGGDTFAIKGLPIATDALALEAGLDIDIGRNTTVGIAYTGQFSSQASDNAVKADLTVRF